MTSFDAYQQLLITRITRRRRTRRTHRMMLNRVNC